MKESKKWKHNCEYTYKIKTVKILQDYNCSDFEIFCIIISISKTNPRSPGLW